MCDFITGIRQEKHHVLIVVNEDESIKIDRYLYQERPLSIGEPIDLREYLEWLQLHQYPHAMNDVIRFLATRARSILEVRQKLISKGYNEQLIDLVLYKLEKEGLIDDEQFAREWIRTRIQRQYGSTRILWELKRKGVCDATAAQSLAQVLNDIKGDTDNDMIVLLAGKMLRRVRNEPDSNKAVRKVLSAMVRRGFSYQDANAAIQAALTMTSNEKA